MQVAHLCRPDHVEEDVKLTLLNDHDRRYVRDSEQDWMMAYTRDVYKLWGCLRCRGHAMCLRDVMEHCISE